MDGIHLTRIPIACHEEQLLELIGTCSLYAGFGRWNWSQWLRFRFRREHIYLVTILTEGLGFCSGSERAGKETTADNSYLPREGRT